jgi:hypothetical protein
MKNKINDDKIKKKILKEIKNDKIIIEKNEISDL